MSRLFRLIVVIGLLTMVGMVALHFASVAPARAATIESLTVTCSTTMASGKTEVAAPFVRLQVVLASNLTTRLAAQVVAVLPQAGAAYQISADYAQQADGTLLVVTVGEWDGSHYLRPATITSRHCTPNEDVTAAPIATTSISQTPTPTLETSETPAPTATAVPAEDYDFTPTPTPLEIPSPPAYSSPTPVLGDFYTQTWIVTRTKLEDDCRVASFGDTLTVTLILDTSFRLVGVVYWEVAYGDNQFWMDLVGSDYIGITRGKDTAAILRITYTSDTTFTGEEKHVGDLTSAQSSCIFTYAWQGVKQL